MPGTRACSAAIIPGQSKTAAAAPSRINPEAIQNIVKSEATGSPTALNRPLEV